MSSNAVATQNGISPGELMERVIAAGDISRMDPGDRAKYVVKVCESAGLNPLTKPFDLITLNGKLTLYATKGATDQLRRLHGVTLRVVGKERIDDVYMVTVEATTPDGRTDTDIGVVTLGNLKGDALANALMKALTKAKRRVTLSICGLGLLDESEFDTIPRQAFSPEPPQHAPTGQESRHSAPPVKVEVVSASTGEITMTTKEMGEEIRKLREVIGWTADDVRNEARRLNLDLRTREGLLGMISELDVHVESFMAEDDDHEPEQGTLIDAETAPIDWSER